MIIVTGGLGFIGSNLVKKLNENGYNDILIVDHNINELKLKNVEGLQYNEVINITDIVNLEFNNVTCVFHLGARTDTMTKEKEPIFTLNFIYSKLIKQLCINFNIPFIYASSAATYGKGEKGYSDSKKPVHLKPLNEYGETKNMFDKHMLSNDSKTPNVWYGFKFFNVYGFGESHKNSMASVIYHGYHQIKETGKLKLFKSYNKNYQDGEQMRDFIFVDDVVDVLIWFMNMHGTVENGIYNLGTGKAESFSTLGNIIINAIGSGEIEYVDMPEKLKLIYQYYTQADISKLKNAGYLKEFTSLSDGVGLYISKLNS